jgi:hypothetical protein
MKVRLLIVPPGGGETDYTLDFELPALPRQGDYIGVTRPKESGAEYFIVRRVWWALHYPGSNDAMVAQPANQVGSVERICIECEIAEGPFSSESHKKVIDMYNKRGNEVQEFDNSAY